MSERNPSTEKFLKEVFDDLPMEQYEKEELKLKLGANYEQPIPNKYKDIVSDDNNENDEKNIHKIPKIKPETLQQIEEHRKKAQQKAEEEKKREEAINKEAMKKYSAKS